MRRTPLAVAFVLALALLVPALAAASPKPLTLDPNGGHPRVAVNAAGTGFFTWTTPASASDTFHYCRIPQGARTCNASKTYNPGDSDVDGGYTLFATGGRVLLIDARCCEVYARKEVFTSTNGGTTFTGPVSPGYMNGAGDNIDGQAVYAPPGTFGGPEGILTISNIQTIGVTFQATGTTAGTQTAAAQLGAGGESYQGSIALQGTTQLVAVFGTLGPARLYWREWSGIGDPNNAGSWTPKALVDSTDVNSTAKLVSGPSGIYVAYSRGATSHQAYFLRRFTGGGFGPALRISEVGSPSNADLVEDGKGVLHFTWQAADGKLHYRYARSAANDKFTSPQTLGVGNFPFLKLAVNSAGRGWVSWQGTGVNALPVHPGEPPYTKPNKSTTVKFGGKPVTLRSPADCVGSGQSFRAKVKGKAKIEKVVFFVDGTKRAVVTGKPFARLLGTKGLATGVHHLRATVTASFKKHGKTRTRTKDLTAAFSIC